MLVTGASSGIGWEIARQFALLGLDVVLVARRADRLAELAAEIRGLGRDVLVVPADLTDQDSPVQIHQAVQARKLNIDILVNCAGTADPCHFDRETWAYHLGYAQLNALGPAHLIHLFLPGMLERGYGRVINVTSVAAFMPGVPVKGFYGPTKIFLYRLTETLATEYHGTGVTFLATAPGFTQTAMLDSSGARPIVDKLPRFTWASPERVARETIAAGLAGSGTLTHTWFNKLVYGAFVRHLPTRYAYRMMQGEADRARRLVVGDTEGTSGIPGLSNLKLRPRSRRD